MAKIYINDQLVKPMSFFDLDSQVVDIPNADTDGASLEAEPLSEN